MPYSRSAYCITSRRKMAYSLMVFRAIGRWSSSIWNSFSGLHLRAAAISCAVFSVVRSPRNTRSTDFVCMEHCAAIWGQDSFLYCFALGFSTAYPFTLRTSASPSRSRNFSHSRLFTFEIGISANAGLISQIRRSMVSLPAVVLALFLCCS